jgi:hypothetical protein
MLGKSNGAVRVIQFRALKQLRSILEAQEPTTRLLETSGIDWGSNRKPLPAGSTL